MRYENCRARMGVRADRGGKNQQNTDSANDTTPPRSFHQLTAAAHRPVVRLLDRLDGLTETGPGTWKFRCPAHSDRNPSGSLKEAEDGTVLIRCWAGCTAAEIVAAIGIELSDLFPRTEKTSRRPRDQHRLSARDAIEIIRQEVMVVACAGQSLLDGTATVADVDRVGDAVTRINRVMGGIYGI